MDIKLEAGDIIIDVVTNESGLLIQQYNIFEHTNNPIYPPLPAWEIIWSGKNVKSHCLQAFTEEGLINMIRAEVLILIKNN